MEVFLQTVLNGLIIGGTYALMAVGLTFLLGFMDLVNFSHGEFYMLGAYFTYLLIVQLGLPHVLGIPLAICIAFLLGLVVERVLLRPIWHKGVMIRMLMTVGLMIALPNLITVILTAIPRKVPSPVQADTVVLGPLRIAPVQFVIVVVAVLIILLLHQFMQRTKTGKAMRATFQDKDVAAAMGINTKRIYSLTFGLGCAMAAAGGALLSMIYNVMPTMGTLTSSKAFAVVILGGLGNFAGAIVGALIVGVSESLAATFISTGYKDAVAFILLILILMVKPSGIMGKRGGIE
ncbi:MAG: branched-chain amino acid ABC transporter permease [Bacillota bacterium]